MSQPAISTGTSPEVSPESTINPLLRQLAKSNLTLARSRVSFGSVLSAPTSSSQEDETTVYLPEEERKKINLDALNFLCPGRYIRRQGTTHTVLPRSSLEYPFLRCERRAHQECSRSSIASFKSSSTFTRRESVEAVTESRQLSTGCDVKEDAAFAGLQRMHQ